jgi:hypothetical protein
MIPLLFSALLLAVETPVAETASPTTEAAPAVEHHQVAKKEKKICKVDPANTGSRMKRNICLTQVEWEKRAAGKNAGDLKTIGGR